MAGGQGLLTSVTSSPETGTSAPGSRRSWRPGRGSLVLPPLLFVALLLLAPIVFITLFSVGLRSNVPGTDVAFSLDNWKSLLFSDSSPFRARFLYSMKVALVVSLVSTVAAYPLAYFLSFVARKRRYTLLLLLLAPFFTSYLLRVLAWQIMLNDRGVVTSAIWAIGLKPNGEPVPWLIYSTFSVSLVLFYSWVPFVALPIFAVLENMDHRLLEAAQDLGASRWSTFWRVTFPLSLPGVIAGFIFVLIPTTGEFIAPLLVGGPNNQLFGNSIQAFFGSSSNWNYGSVLAMTLIFTVVVLMLVFGRFLNTDLRTASRRDDA